MTENHGSGREKGTRNRLKKGYMFTSKKQSPFSIMSIILGTISLVSVFLTLILTYIRHGEALLQYGTVLLLCMIFGLIGLGLAVFGRLERDRYYACAYVGMGLNILTLVLLSLILYAGA